MDLPPREWYRADQVAEYLGITRAMLLQRVREGKIKAIKLSRVDFRFTQAQIDDFLAQCETVVDLSVPKPLGKVPSRKMSAKTRALLRRQ